MAWTRCTDQTWIRNEVKNILTQARPEINKRSINNLPLFCYILTFRHFDNLHLEFCYCCYFFSLFLFIYLFIYYSLSRVMQLLHFVSVCVSTIVSLLYMHLFRWAKEKRVNDIVCVHKCTKGTKNVFTFGFTTKSVFELRKRTQNLFSRYVNFPVKTHQESRIIIVP